MQILKLKPMKIVRTALFAIMALCFFGSAQAQVRINAHIGTPPPRHRVVVVHRQVRHYPVRRHYVHRRHVVVRRHY